MTHAMSPCVYSHALNVNYCLVVLYLTTNSEPVYDNPDEMRTNGKDMELRTKANFSYVPRKQADESQNDSQKCCTYRLST